MNDSFFVHRLLFIIHRYYMLSLFINWDVSPEIFNLGGISIRYYGLLFAVAFLLGYKVEEKMFKSEGLPMAWLDKLWAICCDSNNSRCTFGTLYFLRLGLFWSASVGNGVAGAFLARI